MPKGIFAAAIFVSAFLLFWVQPLFSKMVLPLLGGSPSVWNTAMMFFQLVLLAGYGYAHLLTHRIKSLRWQFAVHGIVVAAGLLFLPFAIARGMIPPADASPIPWLVGLLALSVGWPFFALSASAPLVQAWFARSGHRLSGDPYFLYAASNSGSLLALLAFPILLEPALTLAGQARAWTFGYGALLLLLIVAGFFLSRVDAAPAAVEAPATAMTNPWRQRLTWIALAFVPSSLLLGVTTYITTDIASAPLLWVVPLALYLLSFIVAFAQRTLLKPAWTLKAQAIGILVVATMVTLVLLFERGGSVLLVAGVHLLTFFITAVVCHTELARRRPGVEGLTEFYFCMSIGGALGGIFNALVAPLIFTTDYEYYLALVGACALRVFVSGEPKDFAARDAVYPGILAVVVAGVAYSAVDSSPLSLIGRVAVLVPCAVALYAFTARPFRFAFGVAAMIGSALLVQGSIDVLHTERNFFGINRVKRIEDGAKTVLIHGTTMHGTEFTDPKRRREPLAYYAHSGPVGQLLALAGLRPNVAAIGLGTGALACYRKPGESWTFFEIDGAVERIARDPRYFHYLGDCGEGVRVVLGDGRLSLKAMPNRSYDLIVIDAFSSDSIPMHLLTKEALALYLQKLKPRGIILFNISNEYLNLAPVLSTLVASVGAAGRHELFQPSATEVAQGASASEWMAIAATDADLAFVAPENRWHPLHAAQGGTPWSDDFSNIVSAIRW
jgi:hypothetical protein